MSRIRNLVRVYASDIIYLFLLVLFIGFLSLPASADQQLDSRLAQAKKDNKVVMLEVGSVGCLPCENMKPVMARLSATYKSKLDVIFVDVRKDNEGARKFGVYGIPTQVFLDKNGKEFHRHVGFYPYDQIVPILKKAGM
jgi:thioredoxin 1